jgi:hypothetical protein
MRLVLLLCLALLVGCEERVPELVVQASAQGDKLEIYMKDGQKIVLDLGSGEVVLPVDIGVNEAALEFWRVVREVGQELGARCQCD